MADNDQEQCRCKGKVAEEEKPSKFTVLVKNALNVVQVVLPV